MDGGGVGWGEDRDRILGVEFGQRLTEIAGAAVDISAGVLGLGYRELSMG